MKAKCKQFQKSLNNSQVVPTGKRRGYGAAFQQKDIYKGEDNHAEARNIVQEIMCYNVQTQIRAMKHELALEPAAKMKFCQVMKRKHKRFRQKVYIIVRKNTS